MLCYVGATDCIALHWLLACHRYLHMHGSTSFSGFAVHTHIHHNHRHHSYACVPMHVSENQKTARVGVCLTHLLRYVEQGMDFIDKIVTGNESWYHHFDPSSKRMDMEWWRLGSPYPHSAPRLQKRSSFSTKDFYSSIGYNVTQKLTLWCNTTCCRGSNKLPRKIAEARSRMV